jgi:hypothetical protein
MTLKNNNSHKFKAWAGFIRISITRSGSIKYIGMETQAQALVVVSRPIRQLIISGYMRFLRSAYLCHHSEPSQEYLLGITEIENKYLLDGPLPLNYFLQHLQQVSRLLPPRHPRETLTLCSIPFSSLLSIDCVKKLLV